MRKVKEMQNRIDIVLETTKQDSGNPDQKWSKGGKQSIWIDRV